jgi:serine phosphatase RsbU (regulator of sigma subunit)
MAKRGGPSLSIKMMVTTTALIVVTVVGSGLLNVMNVRRVFDATTKTQIDVFRAGREANGDAFTPLFARTVEPALIDKGQDKGTRELVAKTVTADTKVDNEGNRDHGLRFALVLDLNGAAVAHCIEGDTVSCIDPNLDGHPPVDGKLGQVTVDAWKAVQAAWRTAAKTPANQPLVKVDITGGDDQYQVFAYPVMFNAQPTASAAIATDPGARLGYVVLGYDLAPIAWFEATAERDKSDAENRAKLYTAAVGLLFALIGTVFAILQGLSISRPITQLAWRADQIARGDLRARVEVKSRDEIGLLGENFNFMADQIALLLEQTAEKARIEQEIEVARAIQETLVPSSEPVERGGLKFAGHYEPAAQTGGDWWTWHELPGGKLLFVIGDVTGHGVPSAMITAAAKSACDVARYMHGDSLTVTRLLELMNQAIYEAGQRRFVMTCFASIVDPKARTITYANAAHNFPYLFRASGDRHSEFGSLMIRGNRLGDDPKSRYEPKTTELMPGDVIVWYTDGIVECDGPTGEVYGERRFRMSIKRAGALEPADMRDAIVSDAQTYFGDTPHKDDITLIVGRFG